MLNKFKKILVLAGLLVISAGPVAAAIINVNYTVPSASYQVDIASSSPDAPFIGTTYGLEFEPIHLDFDEDGANDLTTFAYCVDLARGVSDNDTYTVSLIKAAGTYKAAAWIMENYGGSGNLTTNAAAQIAIWETVYDDAPGDLYADSVIFSNFQSTTVEQEANAIVAALAAEVASVGGSANLTGLENYHVATNVLDKQFLLVEVTPVPLPAAVWLFGSVLLGMIGFRKKGAALSRVH